ncbi:MAG: AbrB family transcriptional regulator [Chloroflexi bacterium]|nr:AbrB family transcriptional regulator [Chloroflexota bacterium]
MTQTQVRLDPQGRLVIPASLRKALGLTAGATVVARIEGGRLVLEQPETIWERITARFAHIPAYVSLADELIAERRAEAKREAHHPRAAAASRP